MRPPAQQSPPCFGTTNGKDDFISGIEYSEEDKTDEGTSASREWCVIRVFLGLDSWQMGNQL